MASRPPRSDPGSIVALLSGPGRSDLAQYLVRQRWFAAKTRGIGALAVRDWATLDPDGPLVLLLVIVRFPFHWTWIYLPIPLLAPAMSLRFSSRVENGLFWSVSSSPNQKLG